MPRRTSRWIWAGRIAFAIVLTGLIGYLAAVGLDKADKVASGIGAVLALAALCAPYLLPPHPQPSATGNAGTADASPPHVGPGGFSQVSHGDRNVFARDVENLVIYHANENPEPAPPPRLRARWYFVGAALLAAGVLAATVVVLAQERDSTDHAEISVRLDAASGRQDGSVRGFFTRKGYLVSYDIPNFSQGMVAKWVSGGKTLEARVRIVRHGSPESQAILLKTVGQATPTPRVTVHAPENMRSGDPVYCLADANEKRPGELVAPVVDKEVSVIDGGRVRIGLTETTIPLRPGDAGAPVVDSDGRIVGMAFAMDQNLGYLIPVTTIVEQFPEAF